MRVCYAVGFIIVLYSNSQLPSRQLEFLFLHLCRCVYFIYPSFSPYAFKTSSYIFIVLLIHNNVPCKWKPHLQKAFFTDLSLNHTWQSYTLICFNCFCSPFTSPELFVFSECKRDWFKGQRMAISVPERSLEALSIGQNFLFNYFKKEFSLLLKKTNKQQVLPSIC